MATDTAVAPVGSWFQVSSGVQNVLVSQNSGGDVAVYVGSSAPTLASAFHNCRSSTPFSMSGITGQNVYVRSLALYPVNVVVTTG